MSGLVLPYLITDYSKRKGQRNEFLERFHKAGKPKDSVEKLEKREAAAAGFTQSQC